MLKKRTIFTLLYSHGSFVLSRNFRLQKIGDLQWLQKNYNFSRHAFSIDELIVLDVSRNERDFEGFCRCLKNLTRECFIPIAAGGGIRSIVQASQLLRSGADKVVLNTPIFTHPALLHELAIEFGQQCLVASIDTKLGENGEDRIWIENGSRSLSDTLPQWLEKISWNKLGELYLNSIDRDGTGQGYDLEMLARLPEIPIPLIMAGGAGKSVHFSQGLADDRVDAVATANLLNFVGDGLEKARQNLLNSGFDLAQWKRPDFN